jgi:two-component system, chemotaxis family, CheB/CheR fusion protein
MRTVGGAIEADARAREIDVKVAGAAEPLLIDADPVRVEQMLSNLVANALKFTPAGGRVTLRLSREGDEACLEVSDTGRGVDPALLPNLFETFSPADGAQRRQGGGLGIGLALVRQLAQMHGGRVEAESAGAGQGARFRIWLPASDTSSTAERPAPPADVSLLKGMRILLVDDAIESAQAFKTLLEMQGALVWPHTSGAAAIEAADGEPFDLILCDIDMTDTDGHELIDGLRGRPATARTPALALTGFGRPQDAARALRAGFDGHLAKPVSLQALLDRIADLKR